MYGFKLQGGDVNSVVHIQSPHYRKSLSDQNLFECLCAKTSIWSLIKSLTISRKPHKKSKAAVLMFNSYFLWFWNQTRCRRCIIWSSAQRSTFLSIQAMMGYTSTVILVYQTWQLKCSQISIWIFYYYSCEMQHIIWVYHNMSYQNCFL